MLLDAVAVLLRPVIIQLCVLHDVVEWTDEPRLFLVPILEVMDHEDAVEDHLFRAGPWSLICTVQWVPAWRMSLSRLGIEGTCTGT